jgi:hypothetical protein
MMNNLETFNYTWGDPSGFDNVNICHLRDNIYVGVTSFGGMMRFISFPPTEKFINILSYSFIPVDEELIKLFKYNKQHEYHDIELPNTLNVTFIHPQKTIHDRNEDSLLFHGELANMVKGISEWCKQHKHVNGPVLLLFSCGAGVSRGPLACNTYIAIMLDINWNISYGIVKCIRSIIDPIPGLKDICTEFVNKVKQAE